jgi:hypothetical protein
LVPRKIWQPCAKPRTGSRAEQNFFNMSSPLGVNFVPWGSFESQKLTLDPRDEIYSFFTTRRRFEPPTLYFKRDDVDHYPTTPKMIRSSFLGVQFWGGRGRQVTSMIESTSL